MKITPTTLTLSQFFSSSNELFTIPAYQRRYSWQWKQLAELFDDIYYLKNEDTHLLGSVVCLTTSHRAGLNPLELVDGQQRITSLSIFLRALQSKFSELNQNDIVSEINSFLFCKGIDRKQHNKLLLGDLDNPDFIKVIRRSELDEVKNNNLTNAYDYLYEWINELSEMELNEIYFKFINNVLVIRLDVGEAKDAYRLFETINNRGLKLNSTDIIKNFLLGHASSINEEVLETVKNNWKDLIINLDEIDTDKFFRQLMSGIRTYKVTDTYVIDEFKKYYFNYVKEAEELAEYEIYNEIEVESSDELEEEIEQNGKNPTSTTEEKNSEISKISIVEFSKNIKKSSQIYKELLKRKSSNLKVNHHLYNLQRIKSFPSYIFLLNLFGRDDVNESTLIEILKIIETFMLRRHICEYRTGELDNIFAKLINIETENIIKEVTAQLTKDLPDDDEFMEKFSTADFRREINRAKYILEILEYNLIEDKGEFIIQSGNAVHLEHIIPQTIDTKKSKKEFGDWVKYLGDNSIDLHKQYVNKIGNFTLLAGDLNITASNNPFKDKLKEYSKSNIQMTKDIYVNYKNKEFNFNEVVRRSRTFSQKAVKIWKFENF
jgi:uncharacterized protein with ParB-like and HNH nuclease domain